MSLLQPNPWFSAVPSDLNIANKEYISKPTLAFLRPASPLPAAFDPKIRMSPPIFSTRIKEKPREQLTRDDVHGMLAHATIDDDMDIDAENMAIASGGWCKLGRPLKHTGTDLILAIAPVGWSSTPPLKPDSSVIADDDICELDELKVPMTPITNKRLKLLIENKMGGILSWCYWLVVDCFTRGDRTSQAGALQGKGEGKTTREWCTRVCRIMCVIRHTLISLPV